MTTVSLFIPPRSRFIHRQPAINDKNRTERVFIESGAKPTCASQERPQQPNDSQHTSHTRPHVRNVCHSSKELCRVYRYSSMRSTYLVVFVFTECGAFAHTTKPYRQNTSMCTSHNLDIGTCVRVLDEGLVWVMETSFPCLSWFQWSTFAQTYFANVYLTAEIALVNPRIYRG
jgi:hypothetical protein